MNVYKVKAIKMPNTVVAMQNLHSQIIVQELKKKFTIWEDEFGEFDGGGDPNYSELNPSLNMYEGFDSLEEVKTLLIKKGVIDKDSKFINIEDD